MESRLFQYSIPHFSFDNAKFHSMGNEDNSMGNEDHSMGNEDLFDGERGSIQWGTRWYGFTGVTRISVPKFGVLRLRRVTGMGYILSSIFTYRWGLEGNFSRTSQNLYQRGTRTQRRTGVFVP